MGLSNIGLNHSLARLVRTNLAKMVRKMQNVAEYCGALKWNHRDCEICGQTATWSWRREISWILSLGNGTTFQQNETVILGSSVEQSAAQLCSGCSLLWNTSRPLAVFITVGWFVARQIVWDKDKSRQRHTTRYAFAQTIHLQNLPIPNHGHGIFKIEL